MPWLVRMMLRMGPAMRRAHPTGMYTAAAAAGPTPLGASLGLAGGAIVVVVDRRVIALHIGPECRLEGVLEHDDERALVGHLLQQRRIVGLALVAVQFLGSGSRHLVDVRIEP